jgi:hypothetical protein
MQYLDHEGKVIYAAKVKKTNKSFPAHERLAAMCSHIPNRGEQIVRYYGFYNIVIGYSSTGNPQFNSKAKTLTCR